MVRTALLTVALVPLLCACEASTTQEEKESGPRQPKSDYGIAVGKARDLKGKLESRDREVAEEADEFAE